MNQLEAFQSIHTFIFDVDGVLTDSSLVILENGRLLRTMSTRDGYALKQAVKYGYNVIVITGGTSSGVEIRLKNLGITEIHVGIEDKLPVFEAILERLKLDLDGILYMGDDLPDFQVMRRVGFPTCPSDAVPEIRELARYQSPFKGGQGCVRDVIEKVLKLNKQWL